jgi:nucleoside-diphosphate-sugar epimerase
MHLETRVLVTGGAGFLGSHLCRLLLSRGDEIVAVDNLLTGREDNIADLLGAEGFSFSRQDVVEGVTVDGPVDAVMNLASPASPKDFATLPVEILEVGSTAVTAWTCGSCGSSTPTAAPCAPTTGAWCARS